MSSQQEWKIVEDEDSRKLKKLPKKFQYESRKEERKNMNEKYYGKAKKKRVKKTCEGRSIVFKKNKENKDGRTTYRKVVFK